VNRPPPKNLSPQTVLHRLPRLTVSIQSDNTTHITYGDRETRTGAWTLAILDAFSCPRTVEQVLQQLQIRSTGVQDWIDLSGCILALYRAGVLVDELEPSLSPVKNAFDGARIHTIMLNDRERTSRFLSAIQEVVSPGDVVLDIGTGTGILAVAAVHAGASRVFAVEASGISGFARATFKANGVDDRITLIEGWSTQIDLPFRADVLVSEILDEDGLGERVLEATLDARNRLLKANAGLVPRRLRVCALMVNIPDEYLNRTSFTRRGAEDWLSWYGIHFEPLVDIAERNPAPIKVRPTIASGWKILSEPIMLAEVELGSFSGTTAEAEVTGTAIGTGVLNGLLLFFEAELSPGNWLSTRPGVAGPECNWQNLVLVLPAGVPVSPGDLFLIKYQYSRSRTTVNVSPFDLRPQSQGS